MLESNPVKLQIFESNSQHKANHFFKRISWNQTL